MNAAQLLGISNNTAMVVSIAVGRTYVVPATGRYRIHVIGGGGGGAGGGTGNATGGGGGGYTRKTMYWTVGTNVVCTVAAPANGGAVGRDGLAGNYSAVADGVDTVIAYGGGAGLYAAAGATVAGGAGGVTNTQGDLNVNGGAGGSVTVTTATNCSTGGGAVGLLGAGVRAGNVTGAANGAVTGGASPGGGSADTAVFALIPGGGIGGPGSSSSPGPDILGNISVGTIEPTWPAAGYNNPPFGMISSGTGSSPTIAPQAGGATGALNAFATPPKSGAFCGGGAAYNGGNPSAGGTGGGGGAGSGGGSPTAGAKGGQGLIFIEVL